MLDKGRRGLHESGGTVWNTLKKGVEQEREEGKQILKRGRGQLGQQVITIKCSNYGNFEQTSYVVHASIYRSCFILQQSLRWEIFKIFGKGGGAYMGGLDKPLATMYNRNSHMHNYNRNTHMHNALQKIMWHFQKCTLCEE